VHFVHVRSAAAHAIPLILTHGWPWTFWDYKDVIEPLAAAGFDIVVPSLPGYGFSAPLRTTRLAVTGVAELWVRLMRDVLGYQRFAAAGGDWGAAVTADLGHAHAEHLLGVYLTMAVWPGRESGRTGFDPADFADDEQWMLTRLADFDRVASSHIAVQTKDPQTLAYALGDSPVGTAAWLWERRRAWSDCDGDVLSVFDRDFLCTTAAIYWLTGTIGTSFRLYFEHFRSGWPLRHDRSPIVEAPTGIGVFPKDLVFAPRALAERDTNLVRWSMLPRGGHFAPAEQPGLVVKELEEFFHSLPR
jgi:pimeloyl-ACP methyl ester carboxylesterase